MGYIEVMATCVGCGELFLFNPFTVPSIAVNGIQEPICRRCVDVCNPRRIANGLDPIVPAPDAYEPVDEREW